ncbi:MAG: hypothetical protein Q8P74_00765 [bacterium]|nr:hypothetical protein [bacterium]
MKKIIIITISLSFAIPVFVSANGGHSLSVDDVLTEIMEVQSVDEAVSINCQDVADEQFERLGEAAMSIIHPDEKQHELMDQMRGGEGSENLKVMHIVMGENYLGCGTGGVMGGGMMGGTDMMSTMMGGGGGMMNGGGGMMGWNNWGIGSGWGWFGLIFMILLWILAVVGIVALIKWLVGKTK